MKSIQVQEKMNDFNSSRESKPFFCVMNQYNTMVLNMMAFVRAVRTGSSISQPWKFSPNTCFCAHGRLNYVRMVALYLAEMKSLGRSDPDICNEFLDEN